MSRPQEGRVQAKRPLNCEPCAGSHRQAGRRVRLQEVAVEEGGQPGAGQPQRPGGTPAALWGAGVVTSGQRPCPGWGNGLCPGLSAASPSRNLQGYGEIRAGISTSSMTHHPPPQTPPEPRDQSLFPLGRVSGSQAPKRAFWQGGRASLSESRTGTCPRPRRLTRGPTPLTL